MRVRWLPEVFAARGRTPLPRDLHRPRPGLRLMLLGTVVSLLAGLSIAALGYGLAAAWVLVDGPRDAFPRLAMASVVCTAGAVLGPRTRTALIRRWIASEDARRPED
ncbi:hypothetical protein AB0L40_19205 [Patulibacter sp. NPDC049589]|uniref:hypothetical protein n=1 Tax=Patulibacter sp. NPDC049589 TaxID=3154731 RepID=UPI0034273E47